MFASLRVKLKSLRKEDDGDARIARRARRAEREVTTTASQELRKWEEDRGYVRRPYPPPPSSASPALSFKELPFPSSGQSSRTLSEVKIEGSDSASVKMSPSQTLQVDGDSSPRISLTQREISMPPRLEIQGGDIGLPSILSPEEGCISSLDVGQRAAHSQDANELKELEEKEALLKEIQKIRQTITDLRTGSSSPQASLPTSPTVTSRCAPWLTPERIATSPTSAGLDSSPAAVNSSPMPRSNFVKKPRTKSVADIFALDAPQPYQPYVSSVATSSAAPQLPSLGEMTSSPRRSARPRSATVGGTTTAAKEGQENIPQARNLSSQYHTPPRSKQKSRPKTLYDEPLSLQAASINQPRRIVATQEEQAKRYREALGHTSSKASRHRHDSLRGVKAVEMSLSELQDRHLAKLRQLQSATTAKLAEAQAIAAARQEWDYKKVRERREQERKAKEREAAARATVPAKEGRRRAQSFILPKRNRTKSLHATSNDSAGLTERKYDEVEKADTSEVGRTFRHSYASLPQLDEPGTLASSKRAQAVRRASEWRKSVLCPSNALILEEGTEGDITITPHKPGVPRIRTQSLLDLGRPDSYMAVKQAEAPTQGEAVKSRPHSRRCHSSLALLTSTVKEEESVQSPPTAPAGREGSRRELTTTDLRRLKEGAGRRKSCVPNPRQSMYEGIRKETISSWTPKA